jgi:hypothetical protein
MGNISSTGWVRRFKKGDVQYGKIDIESVQLKAADKDRDVAFVND